MISSIKKYLRRHHVVVILLGVYIVTFVSLALSGLLFFYLRSALAFLIITILVFSASYLGPLWFRLFLRSKTYQGKYRGQLLDLAKKFDCEINDIFVRKSNSLNACAFSYGNNKTVCFNSNVFERCSWKEIEAVMAHEVGHHLNGDIYLYTTIVTILLISFSWLGIFLLGASRNILQLMENFLLMGLILVPVELAISRWREGMADTFAKEKLSNAQGLGKFLSEVVKDAKRDGVSIPLVPSTLRRWSATHPWILERITRFNKN